MLDAFIIEELRRREEVERGHADQPRMELPLEEGRERPPVAREEDHPKKSDRGVIVIDY